MADRKARYERRQRAGKRRLRASRGARLQGLKRTIIKVAGGSVMAVLIIGSLFLYASTRKELPPTNFGPGHSESLPPQQINPRPIPRAIQQHVMERGGTHRTGGMLVAYNCDDYECGPDMVGKLAEIVRAYPPQVYLAPYPGMDAKIALAAPGRLLTFDTLDEGKMREFISSNLSR